MAREHARAEHALTPSQAIKTYPMAIFWCLIASTCVIMEGYDTILCVGSSLVPLRHALIVAP